AATSAPSPSPSPAPGQPSFLVITFDALARAAADAQTGDGPVMPNLASLLARGVVFSDATAPASYTLASVGSLLTGQGPLTHGVALLLDDQQKTQRLRPEAPSLAGSPHEH